jgi:hypothetical protein
VSWPDIEFVPDAAFDHHMMPTGFEHQELVTLFEAKKARPPVVAAAASFGWAKKTKQSHKPSKCATQ